MKFAALLSDPSPATNLSARFEGMLAQSRLTAWKPGDAIPSDRRRILIGVAPYSLYDLKLLDAINDLPLDLTSEKIDVLDVLRCKTAEEIEKYIPRLRHVYQTPVIGIWKDGICEEARSGHAARARILELYSIDASKVL